MKWRVVGSDGWRSPTYATRTAAQFRADECDKVATDAGGDLKDVKHRVVRVTTARERLKKQVEQFRKNMAVARAAYAGDLWGRGYAQACRDIEEML